MAEQNLNLGVQVDSQNAFLGKVYKPGITLHSYKNISNVIITLYADEKLIGSKYFPEINEDEDKELFFDVAIPATSYTGEHYLRTKVNFKVDEKDDEITHFDSFFVHAQQPSLYLLVAGFFLLVVINIIFLLNEIVYHLKEKCIGSGFSIDEETRRYAAQIQGV